MGVETRDGPSRGGARAIDQEDWSRAARVNSFGLAGGSGSVAEVVERVDAVSDDEGDQQRASSMLAWDSARATGRGRGFVRRRPP
jgi:hypothetical protein